MSFEHPARLWLLAIPVMLCAWELVRRRRRVALPIDGGQNRPWHWLATIVTGAGLLPLLLLAAAIVIFATPLKNDVPRQERVLTNVELVLDVSGSMGSSFGKGTRYDGAMEAIKQFTSRRKGDAFGLTIFGDEVLRWAPLTTDLAAIQNSAPWLRPETLPPQFGGTEVGKAVQFSHQTLMHRGDGDRAIVLMTDGESPDLGSGHAKQIGVELFADRIVLYAVFVGDGAPPSELSDLARTTNGAVFMASNPESLQGIFEHIDQMNPVRLRPVAPRQVDASRPYLIAALSLLGVYQVSLLGLRFTPW